MANTLPLLAAVAIGACLSLQPPINAVLARTVGSALLASTISIAISLALVLAIWLVWGRGTGDLGQVGALPWWIVLGGVFGVVFVAGSIVVAPVTGVALFFVCVVAGQLVGATVVDHYGSFGVSIRPVGTAKVLGLALVLAGAALVRWGDR